MSEYQPYPGEDPMKWVQENEAGAMLCALLTYFVKSLSPPVLYQPTQSNSPNTIQFPPHINRTHDITMREEDIHISVVTSKKSSYPPLVYNENAASEALNENDLLNSERLSTHQDLIDYADSATSLENQADWVDAADLEDLPPLTRCETYTVTSPIEETTEVSDQGQDLGEWAARLRETRCNTEFPWGQQAEERREKEAKRASEKPQKYNQPVSKPVNTERMLFSNNRELEEHGKYFFSYSYDMDPNWMTDKRVPPFTGDFQGLGVLMNYRWQIGFDGCATVVPSQGENVFGMVYLLSHGALFTLDEQDLSPEQYYVEDPVVVKILGYKDVPLKDDVEDNDIFQNDGPLLDCKVYVGLSDEVGTVTSTEYADCLIKGFHAAMKKGMPVRYVRDCLAKVYEGGGI